ncbi:vomeronasal type-2 receptor 26 [Xenopus laevis]|uniref:Vomeronasal type-2 receptor 26 n=1 Tax=Xenopus laevis TaxID=8355 RepID=A0A8J1LK38_XENLA|nr:vomeronasal type-2 receptor 26 [Xenopus laevis]
MANNCWYLLILILVLLIFPGEYQTSESKQTCALNSYTKPLVYAVDGDIIIGGILQIFLLVSHGLHDFEEAPSGVICVGPTFQYLTQVLAFIYAIEEINNSTELLPNITLGYHIYDSCVSEVVALMSTFSLLSEEENPALNYICQQDQKLVAFVGHLLSSQTHVTAEITQIYGYPQISYGALDPVFNDHFPSIYHSVPNQYSQNQVIIKLLNHFGWTWVGIIASDDESNHQLNYYLKNSHFKTASGEEIFFTKDGNIPGMFHILNWVIYKNGTTKKIDIGIFLPGSDQLIIKEKAITWSPYFHKTPTSLCTEMCLSGYRRARQNGRQPCCFDCVPCSEGEISNFSDLETCVKCPSDQWPNPVRDQCIKKTIDFLSYEDLLGYVLSGCASVFILLTAVVFLIFIKHRGTPIVLANNQNISYILLMALLMSFLCTFMFIGHPTGVTCMLRQATFVFYFSVAISSILGKTMTVLVAFKATKTSNNTKRWGRINFSMCVVFLFSLGEFIICVIWLTLSPPYVESDNQTIPGKIILQCNEGSIVSFFLAVSYIGELSFMSFGVAFIARKLPDRFNEAQHITFSMLVFCSVWASFIPTYLSTKGKHMVAVEIFAIQASSAGLLICIFTPKCYIILLKPELNVKGKPASKIERIQYKSGQL